MKHYYVTKISVVLSGIVRAMMSSTCIVSRHCVTSDMHTREYFDNHMNYLGKNKLLQYYIILTSTAWMVR